MVQSINLENTSGNWTMTIKVQAMKLMEDKASTMDGFGVLHEIICKVLPVYTQKSTPKVPPTYKDNICKYQQTTRH